MSDTQFYLLIGTIWHISGQNYWAALAFYILAFLTMPTTHAFVMGLLGK